MHFSCHSLMMLLLSTDKIVLCQNCRVTSTVGEISLDSAVSCCQKQCSSKTIQKASMITLSMER